MKSLKGMARQMAVFDIETLERFLATHMGHVLGPDYRIRRELANRLRRESKPVPSNPTLVWLPLELFALLLNDGLTLGPDDGQD